MVAPPLQMGWGHVHGGLADDVARRVLSGERAAASPMKGLAAVVQAERQAAREALWG